MTGSSGFPARSHFCLFFPSEQLKGCFSFARRILFFPAQGADMNGVVQIVPKYPQLDFLHSRHQYPRSLRHHNDSPPPAAIGHKQNYRKQQKTREKCLAQFLIQLDCICKTVTISPVRAHLCYLKTFPTRFCFL